MSKKSKIKAPKLDAYEQVTNQIIEAIEAGKDGSGWSMPWHNNLASGFPVNVQSNNDYQGMNVFALWGAATTQAYSSNVWGTYKQWQAAGCQVRRKEDGGGCNARVIKVLTFEKKDAKGNVSADKGFGMRTYCVFNADQVDGFEAPVITDVISETERRADLEAFAVSTRAVINHGGNRAFYRPSTHEITMPNFTQFKTWQDYYSTLCHELTHWTKSLVAREVDMGRTGYAFEELVAELGSAYLCAKLGISNEPREDHADYIASWLKALKGDKKYIFKASRLAQTAVEFLLKSKAATIAA